MNKKDLSKALSIGLCAATMIPTLVSAKQFKDVAPKGPYGWAYQYIDVLSDRDVIKGYPDGKFLPENSVSFEETLELLKGIINPAPQDISAAVAKYGSVSDSYGVSSWAKDAVSLALSRNIITESELKQAKDNNLLGPNRKNNPNRNSIAVYYGRALNLSPTGDESVLKQNDKASIPATTRGYLASLVNVGIFSATGSDGNFEGNRVIKRSEMAKITMLSYDYVSRFGLKQEEKTQEGKVLLASNLNNVDTVIIEKDSKKYQFKVDSNTVYKDGDKTVKFADLKSGQDLKVTYVTNGDSSIAGVAKKIEIVNKDKNLIGYVTTSDRDNVSVKYVDNTKELDTTSTDIKTKDEGKFTLAKDGKIYKYGRKIDLRDLNRNDLIEFKTNSNNEIIEANVYPKDGEVTGKVVDIDYGSSTRRESVTLRLDDDKKYTFYGKDKAKDDKYYNSHILGDIRLDKTVTLQLNYKVVTGIGSQNNNLFVVGEVIDANSTGNSSNIGYVEVRTSQGIKKYYINRNTEFKDKTSQAIKPNQRISDLRGQYVKLELDRDGNIKILTKVKRESAIDAIVQVTDIVTDSKYPQYKKYTVKIVDIAIPDSIKKGTEYSFTTDNNFDKYEILRITGNLSGKDLDEVSVQKVENLDHSVDNYNYNYNNSNLNNGVIHWQK